MKQPRWSWYVVTAMVLATGAQPAIRASGAAYTIPVHFHVLSASNGTGANVSDAMLQQQIDVLNDRFAATPFRFQLASVDHTTNDAWYGMQDGASERAAKTALRRGGAGDYNVYTKSAGAWTYLP